MKLEQQIAFNEEKQSLHVRQLQKRSYRYYIEVFDKIKQDGKAMVLDEKSAERLSITFSEI